MPGDLQYQAVQETHLRFSVAAGFSLATRFVYSKVEQGHRTFSSLTTKCCGFLIAIVGNCLKKDKLSVTVGSTYP